MYKIDISLISKLHNDGTLTKLFKAGIITSKISAYREIYLWICIKVGEGCSVTDAAKRASKHFDKDLRTIWRAYKTFTVSDTTATPTA